MVTLPNANPTRKQGIIYIEIINHHDPLDSHDG